MRILGIDPSDPEAEGGVTGGAILEGFTPIAIGHLERGRECDEMLEWIDRHGVTDVAVEVALDVFRDAEHKGPGARRALTRRLLRANVLAGRLMAYAEIRLGKAHVHAIDSRRWRKLLGVKVCKGETTDHAVARALRLRVPSWPKVSNAHERDGAGVALGVSTTAPCMVI